MLVIWSDLIWSDITSQIIWLWGIMMQALPLGWMPVIRILLLADRLPLQFLWWLVLMFGFMATSCLAIFYLAFCIVNYQFYQKKQNLKYYLCRVYNVLWMHLLGILIWFTLLLFFVTTSLLLLFLLEFGFPLLWL